MDRLLPFCVIAILVVTQPVSAQSLPWIRVSAEGSHFVEENTTRTFHPVGFNYDHDADGRLIEDYWHTEWERVEDDFRDMQKLGANTVRIHLQFGKFMKSPTEPNHEELERLTKLLDLAQQCRLYLDLTGLGCYHKADVPMWYDAMDASARWAAQEVFWKAVATTCKDSSAVFCYDLMNEPVVGGDRPAEGWLGPAFGDKHFVQRVSLATQGRPRHEVARQWVERLTQAVRRADSKHLVTLGFVDWSLDRPGLTSGFVPDKVAGSLDFLAVHIYPKSGKVDEALETLQGFQIGKPVVIEETFPLGCSTDDLKTFLTSAGDNADGWISFFWGKRPEEYDAKSSISDAIVSQWITEFSGMMQEKTANPETQATSTDPTPTRDGFLKHLQQHPDGIAPFSIDLAAWNSDTRDLPIGVFDSGIGGLTVLEAILNLDAFDNERLSPGADGRRDFENEQFVYLGDQANMPYGNYPAADRAEYLKELILKDAAFLLGRRYWAAPDAIEPRFDKPPVKAIVLACNTATAWGLDDIRALASSLKIPVFVVGVVEAGAKGVVQQSQRNASPRTVAVLATVGTCSINAYPNSIRQAAGQAGQRQPVVIQQGSLGLAGAIEGDPAFVCPSDDQKTSRPEYQGPSAIHKTAKINSQLLATYAFDPQGLQGDPSQPENLRLNSSLNYVKYDVTTLVKDYRDSKGSVPIDTVVLGCTHFPLVKHEILTEFARLRSLEVDGHRPYESLIAERIEVVDPAELTAKELFRELTRQQLRRKSQTPAEADSFFISVANPGFSGARRGADGGLDREYKYGRAPGNLEIEDTIVVPMTRALLPATSKNLIQTRLPSVWSRLQAR
jgi:glutamate racemase